MFRLCFEFFKIGLFAMGVGVVAGRGLVEDVGAGALQDRHIVIRHPVPPGDDEHADGPPVPDGVHGRGVLGVPGALDAGGLDCLCGCLVNCNYLVLVFYKR